MAYPFSWFEASYQYTDIKNALYSDVPAFSGGQTYKDKSFDFKFKIFDFFQN
ncbi:MAG: YjbH domain-containing protein [bacterium]